MVVACKSAAVVVGVISLLNLSVSSVETGVHTGSFFGGVDF
jgi:hypothetical protein